MLTGGCFCGEVRYRVTGAPFHPTCCHCSMCRRIVGAASIAWFSVRPHEFQIVAGALRRFRSSAHAERSFCGRCGTHLTFARDGQDEIDITTASLDDPEAVPPRDNVETATRLTWVRPDGLPDHPASRPPSL